MLFCNPHYLTPSALLPGNPEKVYDGLLGLEGLILVGDMTDGRLRRAGVMEDVLSWRRGTCLPPPSFVHSPACLSISDAINLGLLARQINSLLADPLKLLPS